MNDSITEKIEELEAVRDVINELDHFAKYYMAYNEDADTYIESEAEYDQRRYNLVQKLKKYIAKEYNL